MSEGKVSGSVEIGPYGPGGRSLHARVDRDLAKIVNHLIHLGYDLVGAYKLAIERVESPDLKQSLQVLSNAHAQRFEQLSERIGMLGAEPAHRPDLRVLLEKARVVIGERRGDRGILEAMAANEKGLIEEYEKALSHGGMPEEIREVLREAIAEEIRHREFYDQILEQSAD